VRGLAAQVDLAGLRDRAQLGDGVAHDVVEGDALDGELEAARVDPRQLEQVVDHAVEAVRLHADLAEVAVLVVDHAVLERLGHGADPGERRAQVVRHPRDELAAAALLRLHAVARVGEAAVGGAELAGQLRELGAGGAARLDRGLLAHRGGVAAELAAAAHEGHAEHRGHDEGDQRGDGGDGEEGGEARVVDEHARGDGDHAAHDGHHGGERDHADLQDERAAAEQAQQDAGAEADDRGADERRQHDDEELVAAHASSPEAGAAGTAACAGSAGASAAAGTAGVAASGSKR
jgi:hypothetical protein